MLNVGDYVRYKESMYTKDTKISRVSFARTENSKTTYVLQNKEEISSNYIIANGSIYDVLREGDLLITNAGNYYNNAFIIEAITVNNAICCFPDHVVKEEEIGKVITVEHWNRAGCTIHEQNKKAENVEKIW